MKKEYLYIIVAVIVIAAIAWYFSNKKQSQTSVASDAGSLVPSGGGGSIAPSDMGASLFSKFQDILSSALGGKSSTATGGNVSPISNVIQNKPFSDPIAAPTGSSLIYPSSTVSVDKPVNLAGGTPVALPIPKTDFSQPISDTMPVKNTVPVNGNVIIGPAKFLPQGTKIVNGDAPLSNVLSRPIKLGSVPIIQKGQTISTPVGNVKTTSNLVAVKGPFGETLYKKSNYERTLFETL